MFSSSRARSDLCLSALARACLSQPLPHVLQLSSQVRPLPLGLGTCLPLRLELLFHLLNSRLVFLDSLLNLCNKRLLIVELGQKSSSVLLLALDGRLQLLPGSLEVAD